MIYILSLKNLWIAS